MEFRATGVTTNIVAGGHDQVNVGNNGSVSRIHGTLNISNPPNYNTININDSADTANRVVTLSNRN